MRSTVLRGSATLALAALLAFGAAAAVPSPEPAAPAAGAATEAKASAAEAGEGDYKLVCRREPSTGSFLSTERTCRKVRKGKRSAPEAD